MKVTRDEMLWKMKSDKSRQAENDKYEGNKIGLRISSLRSFLSLPF